MTTDRRTTYILAGRYSEALEWATAHEVPDWKFISHAGDLRGLCIEKNQVVRVGTWNRRDDIREINEELTLAAMRTAAVDDPGTSDGLPPAGTPPRNINPSAHYQPLTIEAASITGYGTTWGRDHYNHLHIDMDAGEITLTPNRIRFRDWDGQVRDDHGRVIGHLESLTAESDGTTRAVVVFTDEDFLSQVRTNG